MTDRPKLNFLRPAGPAAGPVPLVAHLGAHKTATSLVQKYFKAKRKYYLKQEVLALTRGEVSPYISWGDQILEDPGKLNGFLHEKAAAAPGCSLLLSNENALGRPFKTRPGLYPDHGKIIDGLPAALEGFRPRIVYSIRPPWEFLESYYLQMVHQGYYQTFNQYIGDLDLAKLSWTPIIERLQQAFGKENVSVMDFGLIRQGQEVFLKEFISRNLPEGVVPDLEYDAVHNASISDRGLQMALRVNPLLRPGETGVVRRFLQEHFSNRTEPRPLLMSEQQKSELKARYEDEYNALVQQS
ncbi:hypothetical protein [Leisingera thetidis]|uniref:hypothetical protein n=1 Tax=Leisingera thetidis TaxID=2930199 RepID=UPI0021F6B663|nr:hypothetical protein [Leisingera thetidis]